MLQTQHERTISCSDGRELALLEAGDPTGALVIVHNGTPSARLLYRSWTEDAAARGIRLVGYDRELRRLDAQAGPGCRRCRRRRPRHRRRPGRGALGDLGDLRRSARTPSPARRCSRTASPRPRRSRGQRLFRPRVLTGSRAWARTTSSSSRRRWPAGAARGAPARGDRRRSRSGPGGNRGGDPLARQSCRRGCADGRAGIVLLCVDPRWLRRAAGRLVGRRPSLRSRMGLRPRRDRSPRVALAGPPGSFRAGGAWGMARRAHSPGRGAARTRAPSPARAELE
jgi:hypothetical protein